MNELIFKEGVDVPCNGCTVCCRLDAVRILPHEDSDNWITEPHAFMPETLMLSHKPNGDCVYLDDHGCSIHGHAPQQCRTMDCRNIAKSISFEEMKRINNRMPGMLKIWRIGKRLIKEHG